MSHGLISRSPDLKRLRDEGYALEVRSSHLLVRQVPYVDSESQVRFGVLVSELTLAGQKTAPPKTHVMYLAGEYPCNRDGSPIEAIRHSSATRQLAPDVTVNHSFSSKPPSGRYGDYYEKVTTYVRILTGPAAAVDPGVTATPFLPIQAEAEESVFRYFDTASSRAGIMMVTQKLEGHRIGIVGVGGTGSYVLDLVAKTPVSEIHLFDGDVLLSHNAFRSPGAAPVEQLEEQPNKAEYFQAIYDQLHRGVLAHPFHITSENVNLLMEMDFVFVCRDGGQGKKMLLDKLVEFGIPYVDVGIGVDLVVGSLSGTVRTTMVSPAKNDHVATRIPTGEGDGEDAYSANIQIADLNALNASLAVIRWKKFLGFYLDLEHEHHSAYAINGNELINEEQV